MYVFLLLLLIWYHGPVGVTQFDSWNSRVRRHMLKENAGPNVYLLSFSSLNWRAP